jgi:hypothetical protein
MFTQIPLAVLSVSGKRKGRAGWIRSRDSFPEKKTQTFLPKSLKEGENIRSHLQDDGPRMVNHFSGNLV